LTLLLRVVIVVKNWGERTDTMNERTDHPQENKHPEKKALDQRLDALGWGLFLIMIGGLWLAPEGTVPEGTWLVGTGVIILGLMLIRYVNGIKVNAFWLVVGVIALGFGISDVFGLDVPVLPILLIIIGVHILLKPLLRKQ
jgi:hypothetical protein